MKIIIVGLGNPGDEYANTRHNIGFMVLDELAKRHNGTWSLEKNALQATIRIKNKQLVLIKPTTYMNLSGKAVAAALTREKIEINNLLVISDDLAIDFGRIRIRPSGSAGGHNGLADIEATLQTKEYARMRMGIGANFAKGQQANYVLSKFKPDEFIKLSQVIAKAADACEGFALEGLTPTMNKFNS